MSNPENPSFDEQNSRDEQDRKDLAQARRHLEFVNEAIAKLGEAPSRLLDVKTFVEQQIGLVEQIMRETDPDMKELVRSSLAEFEQKNLPLLERYRKWVIEAEALMRSLEGQGGNQEDEK